MATLQSGSRADAPSLARADRVLPRAPRALQVPAQRRFRRRAAALRQRQALQAEAAGDVSRRAARMSHSAIQNRFSSTGDHRYEHRAQSSWSRAGRRRGVFDRRARGRCERHRRVGHARSRRRRARVRRTSAFKQEGKTVTGTYKGQLGEAPVTGTVKGNEVRPDLQGERAGRGSDRHLQGHGRRRHHEGQGVARRFRRRHVHGQEEGLR